MFHHYREFFVELFDLGLGPAEIVASIALSLSHQPSITLPVA